MRVRILPPQFCLRSQGDLQLEMEKAKSLRETSLGGAIPQMANFAFLAGGQNVVHSMAEIFSIPEHVHLDKSLGQTPNLRQNRLPHTSSCTARLAETSPALVARTAPLEGVHDKMSPDDSVGKIAIQKGGLGEKGKGPLQKERTSQWKIACLSSATK